MPAARASRVKSGSLEATATHRLAVHPCFGAQHALHQRLFGHLQRKDRHAETVHGRLSGDVEAERRFSHRGTGGHDDQLGRLESRRHFVQICEAARHTGNRFATALERFDALHRGPEHLLQPGEPLVTPLLGDLKYSGLGPVEKIVRGGVAVVGLGDDRSRGFDQASKDRLVFDDLGMELDVCRSGNRVHQLGEVLQATSASPVRPGGAARLAA